MDANKLFNALNAMDPSRTPDRSEVAHIARQVTEDEAADVLSYVKRSFKRNPNIPPIGHFMNILNRRDREAQRLNPPLAEPRPASFGDTQEDW